MQNETGTPVFKMYYALREAAQQCHVSQAKLKEIAAAHNIVGIARSNATWFAAHQVTDLKMLADLYDRSKADLVALIVKEVYPQTYKNIA